MTNTPMRARLAALQSIMKVSCEGHDLSSLEGPRSTPILYRDNRAAITVKGKWAIPAASASRRSRAGCDTTRLLNTFLSCEMDIIQLRFPLTGRASPT
jgi:hypothetical protein